MPFLQRRELVKEKLTSRTKWELRCPKNKVAMDCSFHNRCVMLWQVSSPASSDTMENKDRQKRSNRYTEYVHSTTHKRSFHRKFQKNTLPVLHLHEQPYLDPADYDWISEERTKSIQTTTLSLLLLTQH